MLKNIIEQGTDFSRDFEIALNLTPQHLMDKTIEFLEEELKETKEAIANEDGPEIIDGFGDVAFIALNGIYKYFRGRGDDHETATIKTEGVMQRINDANNGKRQADGTVKYVNNKVQKPEGWQPPQYGDML